MVKRPKFADRFKAQSALEALVGGRTVRQTAWPTVSSTKPVVIEVETRQESLGWRVEKSRGRSAHTWGFARCPEHTKDKCRNGVFCQNQIRSAPGKTGHARDLVRKARGCVIRKDEGDDQSDD